MDTFFLAHLTDLANRSRNRGCYTFSDFLNPEEQSVLLQNKKTLFPFSLFGGADGTERQMARFGSEETLGYVQDFPIVCLLVSPKNQKFADTLSHRDFLGTVTGTGIERGQVGDIVIRENNAYIFVNEKVAPYLCEELQTVKHTAVRCTLCSRMPEGALYQTETVRRNSASERLDCIIAAVWHASRNEAGNWIAAKKVFVNGAQCENNSAAVKPDDVISVRGKGKFKYTGVEGNTKKGRISFSAEVYK